MQQIGQSCKPAHCSSSAHTGAASSLLLVAIHFGRDGTGGPRDLNAMPLQEEDPCTLTSTTPRLTLISLVSSDELEATPLQKGTSSPLAFFTLSSPF